MYTTNMCDCCFQPQSKNLLDTLNSLKTNCLMNSHIKIFIINTLIIASDEILDVSEILYGSDKKQRIDLI